MSTAYVHGLTPQRSPELPRERDALLGMVGGKGAGLLALAQLGMNVPPAFCISVAGFEHYRERSRDGGDSGRLPAALDAELRAGYRRLGGGRVAVRSSATSEDTHDSSQAGRFRTFLNVQGEDAVAQAVLDCYRHSLALPDGDGTAMAVVIQRFVAADASGVLFTADPSGSEAPIFLVEAARGLGKAVVDGAVTPDRFRLGRDRFEVLGRSVGQQRAMIRAAARRLMSERLPERLSRRGALTNRQLQALWVAARGIRARVDFDADVEWCFAGGTLHLLQLRPITSKLGAALRADEQAAERGAAAGNRYQGMGRPMPGVWSRKPADELWHGPVTPLMFDTVGQAIDRAMVEAPLRTIGVRTPGPYVGIYRGRVYFSLAGLRAILNLLPSWAMGRDLIEAFPEEERQAIAIGRPVGAPAGFAAAVARVMAARLPWSPPASLEHFEEVVARIPIGGWSGLADADPATLKREAAAAQALLEEFLGVAVWGMAWAFILPTVASWGGGGEGRWAIGGESGESAGNFTTRGNRELLRLAELRRAAQAGDEAAARAFDAAFAEYMRGYGHRTTDRDIRFPRLHEVPAVVLDLVDGLAREGARAPASPADPGAAPQPFPPAGWLTRYARRFIDQRENMRYFADSFLDRLRQLYLRAGALLAEAGALPRTDAVFFLQRDEVWGALDGTLAPSRCAALATSREAQYERFRELEAPELLRDGLPAGHPRRRPDGSVLYGSAASGGHARGPVRLVRGTTDLRRVCAGDVVVARALDPSWTAVLTVASAAVTEVGGILSHAAILAREYGLPAVVGVEGACDLPDGTLVEVDGYSGEVRRAAVPEPTTA